MAAVAPDLLGTGITAFFRHSAPGGEGAAWDLLVQSRRRARYGFQRFAAAAPAGDPPDQRPGIRIDRIPEYLFYRPALYDLSGVHNAYPAAYLRYYAKVMGYK